MRPTHTLWLIALWLMVYLATLVITAPATLILPYLPDKVEARGVKGTVWHAHVAQLSLAGVTWEGVNWWLSPLPLVLGRVDLEIKATPPRGSDAPTLSGHISLSQRSLQAQQVRLSADAATLLPLLQLPMQVQADGTLSLTLSTLDYDIKQGCRDISGSGQWQHVTVSGTQGPIAFGDFNATLACEAGQLRIDVPPPNRLGLTATAYVSATAQLRVEGKFKPAADLPREVHQASRFLGQPDAEGYISIRW